MLITVNPTKQSHFRMEKQTWNHISPFPEGEPRSHYGESVGGHDPNEHTQRRCLQLKYFPNIICVTRLSSEARFQVSLPLALHCALINFPARWTFTKKVFLLRRRSIKQINRSLVACLDDCSLNKVESKAFDRKMSAAHHIILERTGEHVAAIGL